MALEVGPRAQNMELSMNFAADLNRQQAEAVHHYKGPALVLAGPGSGKTRVITYRAAYLVREHDVSPGNILAVTFTNRAAQEMVERLRADSLLGETTSAEVWVHTFHAASVRILREFAEQIGLKPNFAVIDESIQKDVILGCIRDHAPGIMEAQVRLVRNFISSAKIKMLDLTNPSEIEPLIEEIPQSGFSMSTKQLVNVASGYQAYLSRHNALDFDDLVSKAANLLERCPGIRDTLRDRFQFIMLDEYQDINLAEYRLMELLCNPEQNIMAVADDDQSIYSWRGASPAFIESFRKKHNPKVIQLTEHFRSTKKILAACQSLIDRNARNKKKGKLTTGNDDGSIIYYYQLDTPEEEARHITWLLDKLVNERHYPLGQIAIFYRKHALADTLEQYLLEHNVGVVRIRREQFFNDPMTKAVAGYLSLLCRDPELYLKDIISFPVQIMDELTKLQLERRAKRDGMDFGDLLRKIAVDSEYSQIVGPLTKKRIRDFVSAIDELAETQQDRAVSTILRNVLDFVEARRSPYRADDLSNIHFPDNSGNFSKAATALHNTIASGGRVSLICSYGIDTYSAAGILAHVLHDYLDMGEKVECLFLPPKNGGDAPEHLELGAIDSIARSGSAARLENEVVYIVIGDTDKIPKAIIQRSILIGDNSSEKGEDCLVHLPAGEGGVASTTALKLCQRLLSLFEARKTEGLVVYDLETIGNEPERAEILEIAAKKLEDDSQEHAFHQLVKPKKSIPRSSSRIHGITDDSVKNMPGIESVLPQFLQFIGDSILVGHNIVEFDNKIIARCMVESGSNMAELRNRSYDTLLVAKRLFHEGSFRLDSLAERFSLSHDKLHRAEADVDLTEKVFRALRQEELAHSEKKSLPELLPLVALGILERGAAGKQENAAFLDAAARYLRHKAQNYAVLEILPLSHLASHDKEEAITSLHMIRNRNIGVLEDDMDWDATRAKFQDIALDFERTSFEKSLNVFLNYVGLLTNTDTSESAEDKVTMMTVHSAKGKEFDVVIMIGMEQGNFPIINRNYTDESLEEERRLCYVGMTRARKQLYMTSVKCRDMGIERKPSQFIDEIPAGLLGTSRADHIRRVWSREDKVTGEKSTTTTAAHSN